MRHERKERRKKEKHEDGNHTIARFLNIEHRFEEPLTAKSEMVYKIGDKWVMECDLRYHTSLDWLLPVLLAPGVTFEIGNMSMTDAKSFYCHLNFKSDRFSNAFIQFGTSPAEVAWKCAVAFVKWYFERTRYWAVVDNGNPKIDEFMGATPGETKWHESLENLQPAIEKIKGLGYRVTIEDHQAQVHDEREPDWVKAFIIDADFYSDELLNAYDMVVAFAELYKEKKVRVYDNDESKTESPA